MPIAYIGLGSNLNNPANQLDLAISNLSALNTIKILAISSFYWTKFIGNDEQPDVLNAVLKLETQLSAEILLTTLLSIEKKQNRTRLKDVGYSSRTLDLDLLLYANEIINLPDLIVPHPRMNERSFVLFPLAEIAPDLILPNGESVKAELNKLKWDGIPYPNVTH